MMNKTFKWSVIPEEINELEFINMSEVIVISEDDIPNCPKCSIRLEPVKDKNSEDGDLFIFTNDEGGRVYLGQCRDHGQWMFQIESENDHHDRLIT